MSSHVFSPFLLDTIYLYNDTQFSFLFLLTVCFRSDQSFISLAVGLRTQYDDGRIVRRPCQGQHVGDDDDDQWRNPKPTTGIEFRRTDSGDFGPKIGQEHAPIGRPIRMRQDANPQHFGPA